LELRQGTMLEQELRQRIVCGELLEHIFVGRWLARRGFLDDRQLHSFEKNVSKLFRRAKVERPAGELKRLLFKRDDPLAKLATLFAKEPRIDENTGPLHAEEHFAGRHLDRAVEILELVVGLD